MIQMLTGLLGGAKSYIIMAVLGAVVIGGAVFYYKSTQKEIAALNKQVATLELTNQINVATIDKLNFHIKLSNEARYALDQEYAKIDESAADLAKLFSDHDFSNLSLKKPGLIQNLVNKGTKEVLKEFEEMSSPGGF